MGIFPSSKRQNKWIQAEGRLINRIEKPKLVCRQHFRQTVKKIEKFEKKMGSASVDLFYEVAWILGKKRTLQRTK